MSAISSAGLAGARPALQSRASSSRRQQSQPQQQTQTQQSPARGGGGGNKQPAKAPQEGGAAQVNVNLAYAEADMAQSGNSSTCSAFGELLCGCSNARGAKRASGGVCGYAGVAGSSQHGAYLIVSRALGAEFGGVVGLLYYIGHTLLIACYCLAATEIVTVCY